MSSFDEREKSFEKKFAHDQELQFKVSARRNKYIGEWASKILGYDESKEKEWLDWMIQTHIPDVLNTGKFIENKICKIHAEEQGGKSYSIQYLAKNWDDYNDYLANYAAPLQKDHHEKYQGHYAAFRTVLEVLNHQIV